MKTIASLALILAGVGMTTLGAQTAVTTPNYLDIRNGTSTTDFWRLSYGTNKSLNFESASTTYAGLTLRPTGSSRTGITIAGNQPSNGTQNPNGPDESRVIDSEGNFFLRRLINPGGVRQTEFLTGDAINKNTTIIAGFYNDKMGIGTTAPAEKLHVLGNIKASGVVSATQGLRVGQAGDIPMGTFTSGTAP